MKTNQKPPYPNTHAGRRRAKRDRRNRRPNVVHSQPMDDITLGSILKGMVEMELFEKELQRED